jgi:hypothetical protein
MSDELYALTRDKASNAIADAHPIDPGNGTVLSYSLRMGTSDVLGIRLALRAAGFEIVHKWAIEDALKCLPHTEVLRPIGLENYFRRALDTGEIEPR